jgi:hypothetical protein
LKPDLHYRRRPKRSKAAVPPAKPSLTEDTVTEADVVGSGRVIGFWLLPTSSGYVKLKIFDSYPVSVADDRGPKVLTRRTITVKSEIGGSFLPIWPVLNATDTLSKFFSWIENLTPGADGGMWSSDVTKRIQASKSYQQSLINNGLCFVIMDGDTVKWCGSNRKVLAAFIQELAGLKLYNPTNLSLLADKFDPDNPDESEVTKLALMNGSGVVQKVLSVDSIFKSLLKRPDAFSSYINGIRQPVISDFYAGEVAWDSPTDWAGIEDEKIMSAMRPDSLIREYAAAAAKNRKKMMISATVAIKILKGKNLIRNLGWEADDLKKASDQAPEIAKLVMAHTQAAPPPSSQSESILVESSFKELLRNTADNGGYKIGGLRRIGRIWVYDRTVPDRVSNSRFVVTRRPILQLGEDGFPVYKFQFRSRPDRNTTNMTHQGYVKFIEKPKFLARVRNFFREEIDLQVHVGCTCFDFKYRWHWVLAKNNCSHEPTGIGFDAIDRPPRQTNPGGLISMCKHLVVAKDYILLSANEHQKIVKNLQRSAPLKPVEVNNPDSRLVEPGTEVADSND